MNTAFYSMHKSIPFSVYGENVIILVQNLIIVLLFWVFNRKIGMSEKLVCLVIASGYSYVLFQDKLLTEDHWFLVTQSTLVLSIRFLLISFIVLLSRIP